MTNLNGVQLVMIVNSSDPPQRDPSVQSTPPPTKQSDLPARKMLDSYREAVIPLSTDKQLWQKYINFYHRVRLGRILEDLDTMAGISWFAPDDSLTSRQQDLISTWILFLFKNHFGTFCVDLYEGKFDSNTQDYFDSCKEYFGSSCSNFNVSVESITCDGIEGGLFVGIIEDLWK